MRARYVMGTICAIHAADEREIDAAFEESARLEGMLSTWRDDSELARLNAAGSMIVSDELLSILRATAACARETDGAFNPLVRPLIDLWDTRSRGRLPSDAERQAVLPRLALSNLTFDGNSVSLANGARIEEGAFGKGLALDRMLAKITAPEAVINFGGQILVRGRQSVTIAHPLHRERPFVALELTDESLSTSSASERSFVIHDVRFSHILDPATGMALPPRGSVSVIAKTAFAADMLSTALYVMGPERGLAWARAHDVRAIFISETGEMTASSPITGLTTVKEKP